MVANGSAPDATSPAPSRAVPLHVLTGFLGSGKTTLLAELLRTPPRTDGRPERLAVLVNETGALPLDAHLLERPLLETVDDEVLALARLAARAPDRILIETTGLADPAPLLHGLAEDRGLAGRVAPAGVITVVDALRAEDLHATQPEFRRQLEFADRVVLTKGDLAGARLAEVRTWLGEVAPGCDVAEARDGRVDFDWLLHAPPLARLADAADAARWLHPADTGPDAAAHAWQHDAPVDIAALQLWLGLVTQLDGPRLLRFKALARGLDGDVFALQSAGRSVSPPRRLTRPPHDLTGVQAVLIERGLGAPATAGLLASLAEAAAARPWDRAPSSDAAGTRP